MFGKHLAHRGKLVAVVDVGSASAAVAFVALSQNAPAEVLAAERSVLPMEERSKEATIAALGEHIAQAAEKAAKAYIAKTGKPPSAKELYCITHAPWSRSITAQAYSQSKEQVKVTQSMIGALARNALGEQKALDAKQILEASVVRIELNGYPTGKPLGKLAHELEVWALVSDCDPTLRAEVEASLQSLFPHLKPAFRSATRAALSALYGRLDANDCLFVDIVSDGTTLIAVRDGAIAEQHVVAEGVRSILKRVAPTGMPEETLSLIRMLEREQCSTAACEAIQTAMAKVEPELVRAFGEGMAACIPLHRLPNKLFLIVQPDLIDWLTKFFSRIDFTQFTLTTQPFSVEPIAPKDLLQQVVPAHGVVVDTGIALATALVNREQSMR